GRHRPTNRARDLTLHSHSAWQTVVVFYGKSADCSPVAPRFPQHARNLGPQSSTFRYPRNRIAECRGERGFLWRGEAKAVENVEDPPITHRTICGMRFAPLWSEYSSSDRWRIALPNTWLLHEPFPGRWQSGPEAIGNRVRAAAHLVCPYAFVYPRD